jgi:mono/diheme cytochrome c family protein
MFPREANAVGSVWVLIVVMLISPGCEQNMADQPRYDPLAESNFFSNGMASRPLVEGTVPRGALQIDDHFFRGTVDGKPATTFPEPPTHNMLVRGRERYNIFCAQCHDRIGNAQGMVVRRGFPAPPSFHTQRLRDAPVGYIYGVISNGFGRMPAQDYLIPHADRWAIVAYVRVLQLSQHAQRDQLSQADLEKLSAIP